MTTQDEFTTVAMSDAQITVRDVATSHEFTFTVVLPDDGGGRLLGGSFQMRENDRADFGGERIARRAARYAHSCMLAAGFVDRENIGFA